MFILKPQFVIRSLWQRRKKRGTNFTREINHGKSLYKRECIVCHGAMAEKSYMGEVPPIKDLGSDARLEMMKQYKEGTLGKKGVYGLADLKKDVMIKLSERDMQDIDLYIKEITGEK